MKLNLSQLTPDKVRRLMQDVERSEEDRVKDLDAAALISDVYALFRAHMHNFEAHKVLRDLLRTFRWHGVEDVSRVAMEQVAEREGWHELEWAFANIDEPDEHDESMIFCPLGIVGDEPALTQ